jgi:hypothetical protein
MKKASRLAGAMLALCLVLPVSVGAETQAGRARLGEGRHHHRVQEREHADRPA